MSGRLLWCVPPPEGRRVGSPGRAALVVVAALLISGCSADESVPDETRAANVVQGAAPGQTGRALGPSESPSFAPEPHTAADIAFVQGMIRHHAQALRMIELIEERSDDEQLALFAERMNVTQLAEMEQMDTWLADRGEPVLLGDVMRGDDHMHSGEGAELMPGMLTDAEMQQLAAAQGTDFERLWLEGMTRHHQGALRMVDELYAAGGGRETEVFLMASHIESDQDIEIQRMAQLLGGL